MQENAQIGKLWWAIPAATLLLLMMLAMVFGQPESRRHGTSFDASDRGFRAAFLLLDELGYPVVRSRRLSGPDLRWVLFPIKATPRGAQQIDVWVRGGGILLLADNADEFAGHMGIHLKITTLEEAADEEPAEVGGGQSAQWPAFTGEGIKRLAGGKTFVDWPDEKGDVLVRCGDKPVVTVYARGQGQIWLLHRPELVSNQLLRKADNGVLVCRLAQAMLAKRPGQIGFDEYFHGMRDRPGVMELLFQRPASWSTYHGLFLLALLLWRHVPRFGAIRPLPGAARRSQQEFLDAMSLLLDRKRDYWAAFVTVRTAFVRELEHAFGLPAGAPAEQIVLYASRANSRSGAIDWDGVLRLLTAAPTDAAFGGASASIKAVNELESVRDELFPRRHAR